MSGGQPRTQTVTERTNSEPWSGAQPALLQALQGAQQQYANGQPAYYPGSTVAPMSAETLAGLGAIRDNAGTSSTLANQQWQTATQAMNPGALPGQFNVSATAAGMRSNPWAGYFGGQANATNPFLGSIMGAGSQQADLSALNPFVTGGASNPMAGQFTSAAGQPVTGAGMDTLTQAATGGMMQNPQLDAIFRQGAGQIRDQMDTAFNRAGRTLGNSNYGDAFGRSLGEFATNLYGNAYETDMNRRMGAASTLAGYEQDAVDRMLGAIGAESQLGESQLGRWYDAASQFGGASESALNRLLSASGMTSDAWGQTRGQNLDAGQFGAGLFDQDLSQSINAYLALAGQRNSETGQALSAAGMLPGIYDFANQGGRDLIGVGSSLEGYNQALIDADMNRYNYDANSGRSNVEWLNAIASGLGALGGTSTTTGQRPYQQSNPFLQALGAASSVASIASMFGFSDRGLKRDAEFIGTDDGGLGWHKFRYVWDQPGTVRYGVMADEVPEAFVIENAAGAKMVDYGRLLAQ